MSTANSHDIKVGQIWERKSDGVQAEVILHGAPQIANPIVVIRAHRLSEIRADGLRTRYRLWRDVETGAES